MNPATYTIESVHGIKQTVVLVPTGGAVRTDSSVKPLASDQQSDQEDRPRATK